MSARDLAERLITNLQRSAASMRSLNEAMSSNRAAWMSLRPSGLEEAMAAFQQQADRHAALDAEREQILAGLRSRLGLDGPLNVGSLADHLPELQARRLRQAGASAREAARGLGVETRLGERLLGCAQQSHVGMFRALTGDEGPQAARSYGHDARLVPHGGTSGGLVDGTL